MDKWIQTQLDKIDNAATAAAKLNTTIPMLLEHKKTLTKVINNESTNIRNT